MKIISGFFLFFGLLSMGGYGQVIAMEQVFPADGYSVFEMGYPIKVAPGRSNRFAYLEFWVGGKEGRRANNYYLQSYGTRSYVEHWFKPITNEGFEPMEVRDLLRLERCYAVVGRQYMEEEKMVHTACRFFGLDGVPKASEPTKLSTYEKKQRKDFRDSTLVSPLNKAMLWFGTDGKRVYAATWNEVGNKVWNKELKVPYLTERYRIKEVLVDDEANPLFLLVPEGPAAGKPLILAKYLHEKEEFYTEQILVPASGTILHSHFALLKEGEIVISGIVAGNGGTGFRNGLKFGNASSAKTWNQVFLRLYKPTKPNEPVLELVSDQVSEIPEKWVNRYQEEGANFKLSRLMVVGKKATLLLEEHYATKKKVYYYDLGCLGFDILTGELIWNEIVSKRQRDSHSDAFMSYVAGISRGKLRLVYLTERGAGGKLLCTSIDMSSGARKDKNLASNESAKYLFFTRRSGMVSNYDMVLIGRGNPSQNDYKLITISF